MIGLVFKIVTAIFCLIGTIGYGKALFHYLGFHVRMMPEGVVVFALGCILYIILSLLVFSRRDRFWSILEHELIHLIFAVIFFKKVHSFNAIRGTGGRVEIASNNLVIVMAPYIFPLATVILLLIKPSVPFYLQWAFNGLLGFTLMFHIIPLFSEINGDQPDLQSSGMLFAVILILFFNLFFIGLSIASLQGNWADMWDYVQLGFLESRSSVEDLFSLFYL